MKLFAILNTHNVKTYGGAQPFRQVVLFVFVPDGKTPSGCNFLKAIDTGRF